MNRSAKTQRLHELIAPAVAACGMSLWGIEFSPQGRRSLLRVYIEKPNDDAAGNNSDDNNSSSKQSSGVSVDDCMKVSHQISGVMDVHDPINGEYVLEVSSPGWDRRFFHPEQMQNFIGQQVALRLIQAQSGRRKMTGELKAVEIDVSNVANTRITLSFADVADDIHVAVSNIDKANLVYQD